MGPNHDTFLCPAIHNFGREHSFVFSVCQQCKQCPGEMCTHKELSGVTQVPALLIITDQFGDSGQKQS